jgi:hypothetical protein
MNFAATPTPMTAHYLSISDSREDRWEQPIVGYITTTDPSDGHPEIWPAAINTETFNVQPVNHPEMCGSNVALVGVYPTGEDPPRHDVEVARLEADTKYRLYLRDRRGGDV